MAWLPEVKKFRRYLYSFWRNLRRWQTHRQTPLDDIGRAYASHRAPIKQAATQKRCLFLKQSRSRSRFICSKKYNVNNRHKKCEQDTKVDKKALTVALNDYSLLDINTNSAIASRSRVSYAHRAQYAEGIYRPKYYTVTLKSKLRVTQGHWKRNHWMDHTRLTISRVIWRWILAWSWLGCGFLFAFYGNYGRICSRLWDI